MPLRCNDQSGEDIHAFNLEPDRWATLKIHNQKRKHLRMPCCDSGVILKTSKLGTFFFAHTRRGPCTTAHESKDHLMIKTLVCRALSASGWQVETEVRGKSPDGHEWIADVMASKGKSRFVVEVQWSRQLDADTEFRQSRYQDSGLKALWLFRQKDFPKSERIPAVRVGCNEEGHYQVHLGGYEPSLDSEDWQYARLRNKFAISVEDFISGVCAKQFWYGVYRAGDLITAIYAGAFIKCWKCDAWTNVVSEVVLSSEQRGEPIAATLSDLGFYPELNGLLGLDKLRHFKVGTISKRYSKTERGEYLANSCIDCNALQGKFFLNEILHRQKKIMTQQFIVTPELERSLREQDEYPIAESRWQLATTKPIHFSSQ